MRYFVYILKDTQNNLYIGQTNNLLIRERQLKGWTRVKKEALIKGNLKLLKKL